MPTDPPTLSRRTVLQLTAAVPALGMGCGSADDILFLPEDPAMFPRTVISGDPTTTSIVLTMWWPDGQPKVLRAWRTHRPGDVVFEASVTPDDDGMVKLVLTELRPGTAYTYTWLDALPPDATARSLIGQFSTLPREGTSPPVTLAVASCVGIGSLLPDYIQPGDTEPYVWPLLEMAGSQAFDLFVHVGDQAYLDDIWAAGGTREQYLAAWNLTHSSSYRAVYPKAPLLATWDDHEITDNRTVAPYTDDPDQQAKLAGAMDAWYTAMPIDGTPETTPVWRSFRWGDTLELLLLDCRYEITPEPDKHQMSPEQLAWFIERLQTSPCRFVCVATDKPFAYIMLNNDIEYPGQSERWQGHLADRNAVTDAIDAAGLDHVIFVTGDIHMNYLGTLAEVPETPSGRLWEVCCTSGNINPIVEGLSDRQFVYKQLEPQLPLLTFDPKAGTCTVRFVGIDGVTSFERVLELG